MAKTKILIVEDEAIVAHDLQNRLKDLGYSALQPSPSGGDALEKAARHKPDLILMDIKLTGDMDGIETAGRIRSELDIPVVFLTAYPQETLIRRARDAMPYGYLLKPVKDHDLVAAIEMACFKHGHDKRLRESEERYRRITDSITDYIFTVTVKDGKAVQTVHSHACAGVTGYTAEEFAADPGLWIAMVPEEDRERVRRQIEDILEGRNPGAIEHRIIRRDCRVIWVRNTPVPSYDREGGLIAYDGLLQDITERKTAEERYRILFETSPDPAVMYDLQGTFIMVNRQTARTYGLHTPEEFIREYSNIMNILDEEGREKAVRRIDDILKDREVPKNEYTFVTREGKALIGEVSSSVIMDQKNNPVAILSIIHNITQRREMENALGESEEKYRLIFQNSPLGFLHFDRNGVITACNDAFVKIIGSTREALTGLDMTKLPNQGIVAAVRTALLGGIGSYEGIYSSVTAVKTSYTKVLFAPIRSGISRIDGGVGIIEDITDRMETERDLRESEEKYRLLVDNANEAIFVVQDGVFKFINPKVVELSGYSPEDFIDRPFTFLVHPEDLDMVLERYRLRQQGEPVPGAYSFRCVRKDGQVRQVLINIVTITWEDRPAFMSFLLDITESARAHEKLQKSEARYRLLAENASDIIFTMDKDLRLTYISPSVTRLRGWSVEEALMQTPKEVLTPVSLKLAAETFSKVLDMEARGERDKLHDVVLELEETCKDGSIIWTETTCSPLRNEKDEFVGFLGMTRDISERKRVEDALREREERYRSFITVSNTGAWEYHIDKDYLWCSPEYFSMLGYDSRDFDLSGSKNLKETWIDLLHPDDRERASSHFGEYLRTGSKGMYENYFRLKHRDGGWVWIWSRGSTVLNSDGSLSTKTVGTHIDITRQKLTEDALRESSLFLNETQRIARLGGWKANPHTDYLEWTEGVYNILEAPPEYRPGLAEGMKYYPPEHMPALKDSISTCLSTGKPFNLELQVITEKGNRLWTEIRGLAPVGDDERSYVMGTLQDITDRKHAEEELRERERKYNTLIENLPGFVYRCRNDRDWTMELISAGCIAVTGYAPEDFIDNNRLAFNDILLPEYVDPLWHKRQDCLQKRDPFEAEYQIRTVAGEVKWVWERGRGVFEDTGKLLFLEGYIEDITDRKKAEEELIKLAAAIQQSAECVVITDTLGKIQYVNSAFEKITGYTREEAAGQNLRILKSGVQDEAFYKDLWNTITGGDMWTGNFINRRKDGTLYHEDASIFPVRDKAGIIVNFVGVKRDITKEVQLEEQVKRSQRLEAIGTLAGGIAHDFNNLLTAIIGFSEMALDETPQTSPTYEMLEEIFRSGERARDLVKQILTFSRQMKAGRQAVRVHLIAKETIKLLKSSIPSTIRITARIDSSTPPVEADPTRIHQVIMNLCTNAYHAMMPDGGELTVCLDPANLDMDSALCLPPLKSGPHMRLIVSDTGCGMDEYTMKRIFEPFFTTKEQGKGTGLGLSTVYGTVTELGGAITVQSEVGRGTTFTIYLSATQRIPKQAEESPEESKDPMAGNILLVDDEKSILHFTGILLEQLGFTVTSLSSSMEALMLFRSAPHRYDLVITDYVMPEMNGAQLAHEVLRIRPDLPVILMTGYSENISQEKALCMGIKRYVEKPFTKKVIARVIKDCLGNSVNVS